MDASSILLYANYAYFILPGKIEFKAFIKAIMSVSFNHYWYFTAYTGVFIFISWFSKLLQNTGKRELTSFLITHNQQVNPIIEIIFTHKSQENWNYHFLF